MQVYLLEQTQVEGGEKMKAALYARVSSEEQVEGYSIDAQRRAFAVLCESRQWTSHREYIEEGKSARTEDINKRPVFKEAMVAGLNHEYDVIVVHKVDRFSRKLRITLDYFDKLAKAEVGFVSIVEQMDFSTPWGKFTLGMLGGLAELYSDNLSQETKKGWHERRSQGLYCGTLPFGATKGENGVPIPDMWERKTILNGQEVIVRNCEGLMKAFELAEQGNSDREVAMALNIGGYRTTGTHGSRPFSKDTVKDMVTNRFYIAYIPDGNGGWLKGKHEPFVSSELFERVQDERAKRRTNMNNRIRTEATTYSLSGIIWCRTCKSKIHIHRNRQGKPRVYCGSRAGGLGCTSKGTFLEVYEAQIQWYLENFIIPEDYREKILEAHRKLEKAYGDTDGQRARLEAALERLGDRYNWGHITKERYLAEYDKIQKQLRQFVPEEDKVKNLDKFAHFLAHIAEAWKEGTQEQRNKVANVLFQEVWIEDNRVVAVKPREELKPLFQLSYEEHLEKSIWRPRGVVGSIPRF
jgi:site-specific DNA recombinase